MTESKKKTFPTHQLLVGKKLYLRPASSEDIANTHHWFLQSDTQSIFCKAQPMMTAIEAAEAFKKQERSSAHQEFVIIRQADNALVGRIKYSDLNANNRSAELFVLIDPEERRKGHATEAVRILTLYAFQFLDLNRVYGYACVKNKEASKFLEHLQFRNEGTLRHLFLVNGEYQDGVVVSLLRFEFDW